MPRAAPRVRPGTSSGNRHPRHRRSRARRSRRSAPRRRHCGRGCSSGWIRSRCRRCARRRPSPTPRARGRCPRNSPGGRCADPAPRGWDWRPRWKTSCTPSTALGHGGRGPGSSPCGSPTPAGASGQSWRSSTRTPYPRWASRSRQMTADKAAASGHKCRPHPASSHPATTLFSPARCTVIRTRMPRVLHPRGRLSWPPDCLRPCYRTPSYRLGPIRQPSPILPKAILRAFPGNG